MGLFGCSHKWKKYRHRHKGVQQYVCKKCGRLKNKRVSQTWCVHKWRMDRRTRNHDIKCVKCGKVNTNAKPLARR